MSLITYRIVHATKVDNKRIYFTCPFCWTYYKKDGTPRTTAKRLTHTCGSNNNFNNRTEDRISHCDVRVFKGSFKIIIDDDTIKIL